MLTTIWNALFEPRYPRRYNGRHRAPLQFRYLNRIATAARVGR